MPKFSLDALQLHRHCHCAVDQIYVVQRRSSASPRRMPSAMATAGRIGKPSPRSGRRYAQALDNYLRRGVSNVTVVVLDLLKDYNVERRDLGTGTSAAGGYLVPAAMLPKVTIGLKRGSSMGPASQLIETGSGGPLTWPTTGDTGNVGAILAENTAPLTQDVTFGSAA